MASDSSGKILVKIGQVYLEAPETLEYLELASRLLEVRRQELNGNAELLTPSRPIVDNGRSSTISGEEPTGFAVPRRGPSRRARWFSDRFPEITMEDGSKTVTRSLRELRSLLESRGLTPHPRGDASMLLWQIRNRLRLRVEPVGTEASEED